MYDLRHYQSDGVDKIRNAYKRGYRSPLYVLPTGGGKTIFFNYIAANAAARGKRVWILVHRIELIRQTSKKLHEAGVMHGVINPKYRPNYIQKIQVASVQSLVRKVHQIPFKPDIIIIDEAHHTNAATYSKIIEANPQALLLGVTATPCRSDESGLGVSSGGFFDTMIVGPQIYELIREGYLSKPVVYAPGTAIDLSGIRSRGGDWATNEVANLMDKPTITGDAVKHYSKLCPHHPTIVFCASILHAQHVAQQFREAGYKFYHIDGNMDDDERSRLIEGLGNGKVEGLTSCDIISEGTDIPAVSCAVFLRPTQSLGLYLQQAGRSLRPAPGKEHAIILDHVGNVIRHGLPDEHRDWSLDAEARKKKKKDEEPTIRTRQCPECYAVHKPTPMCPECGHLYETEGREVEQVDGELRQITDEDREHMRRQRYREQRAAQSLEDLLELAKKKGYKPGWAHAVYNARQNKKTG